MTDKIVTHAPTVVQASKNVLNFLSTIQTQDMEGSELPRPAKPTVGTADDHM